MSFVFFLVLLVTVFCDLTPSESLNTFVSEVFVKSGTVVINIGFKTTLLSSYKGGYGCIDFYIIDNGASDSTFTSLTKFRFLNNFLLIDGDKTCFVQPTSQPVMSFTDPDMVICEVDNTILGRRVKPDQQIIKQGTNERFLLCYFSNNKTVNFKTVSMFIYKALNCDKSLLGGFSTVSMSEPFNVADVKLGKLFSLANGVNWNYYHLLAMDCNTAPGVFVDVLSNGPINPFLFNLSASDTPLFFILKIKKTIKSTSKNVLTPRINPPFFFSPLECWYKKQTAAIHNLDQSKNVHKRYYHKTNNTNVLNLRSPFTPDLLVRSEAKFLYSFLFESLFKLISPPKTQLLIAAPKPKCAHLLIAAPKQLLIAAPKVQIILVRVLKVVTNDKNLFVYISNPYLLSGKTLSTEVFKALLNTQKFLDYGDYKLLTLTVSFNEEDIKAGRMTGQQWGYHPFVVVKNNTAPEQYWRLISSL